MENEVWFRSLVWMDYRLAVLFAVIVPLILIIWAFIRKAEAIERLLIIYWRVASLLMITLYLAIPDWSINFISSALARILIPISLWFWVDINEEIKDRPDSSLKWVFTSWRWAITFYSSLGAICSIPFISCAFSKEAMATRYCQVWLEVPQLYKDLVHPNSTPEFLGFLGMVGLIVYGLYLAYFIFVRLAKQGRSALEQ